MAAVAILLQMKMPRPSVAYRQWLLREIDMSHGSWLLTWDLVAYESPWRIAGGDASV